MTCICIAYILEVCTLFRGGIRAEVVGVETLSLSVLENLNDLIQVLRMYQLRITLVEVTILYSE